MTTTTPCVETPVRRRRVFIVDDHPVFCRGLQMVIEDEPDLEVCGTASTCIDALRGLWGVEPDIVLVDISLKDGNGIDLTRRLNAAYPGLQILIISAHSAIHHGELALRAGARGYVEKQQDIHVVIEAIRNVLAGNVYLDTDASNHLAQALIKGDDAQIPLSSRLTEREMAVFDLIGRGMRTAEIAVRLRLSPKTVQVHRDHIRDKLGLKDGVALQRAAFHWFHREMEGGV